MNTLEVANLFRVYADEPDQSFLTNTDVAQFCKLGYEEFRSYVDNLNVNAHDLRGTTVNIAGVNGYDLTQGGTTGTSIGTPSILGPNPNITTDGVNWTEIGRMKTLVGIHQVDPVTNAFIRRFQMVTNVAAMRGSNFCAWSGNTLTFSEPINGTVMILHTYEQEIGLGTFAGGVPVGQTNQSWAGVLTPLTTVVIDDNLQAWHDIIPLMAYSHYAIMNSADNPQLMQRLVVRKQEFRDYLMTRSFDAVSYVHHNFDPSDLYGGI